jgi:hypothetical protein
MNDLEFQTQYKRLREVHPYMYGSKEKMETIWKFVGEMDEEWFRKFVDNIVAASDPKLEKYDIGQAVIGERRARRSVEFAEDVISATKNWSQITERGLENVLEKYGATNLFEAITKSRKGEI